MINNLFASLDSDSFRHGSPELAALDHAEDVFWDLPEPHSLAQFLKQTYQVLQISPMHMGSYIRLAQFTLDREVALYTRKQ